jgi:hypothetical protein
VLKLRFLEILRKNSLFQSHQAFKFWEGVANFSRWGGNTFWGGGAKYFGGPPENLSIAMAPCIIHPIIIHTPPKGDGHILDGHILDGKK